MSTDSSRQDSSKQDSSSQQYNVAFERSAQHTCRVCVVTMEASREDGARPIDGYLVYADDQGAAGLALLAAAENFRATFDEAETFRVVYVQGLAAEE